MIIGGQPWNHMTDQREKPEKAKKDVKCRSRMINTTTVYRRQKNQQKRIKRQRLRKTRQQIKPIKSMKMKLSDERQN